jgi:hypothetical protein
MPSDFWPAQRSEGGKPATYSMGCSFLFIARACFDRAAEKNIFLCPKYICVHYKKGGDEASSPLAWVRTFCGSCRPLPSLYFATPQYRHNKQKIIPSDARGAADHPTLFVGPTTASEEQVL